MYVLKIRNLLNGEHRLGRGHASDWGEPFCFGASLTW